jgi:integrase
MTFVLQQGVAQRRKANRNQTIIDLMPLELRTQRDGRLRDTWYGRYEINGKRQYVNLDIKVSGTPPKSLSLRDEGDPAFERSRAAAQAKLDSIIKEARSSSNAIHLVEKLYEMKTGEAIRSVKLEVLPDEWTKIPRRREPDVRYASQCKSTLKRFVGFVRSENPKAEELAHVTRTLTRSFMDAEAARGVTAKTWNDTLKLLRATFKYLLPAGAINPLSDVPTKETETVFRIPFSPEELKAIIDAAGEDDFIRPIIVTGICTAMRRGDCCLLQWKDVDLERRFINVKTAKTGQSVSIPIFPMLHEELARVKSGSSKRGTLTPDPSPVGRARGTGRAAQERKGYVFPEQAAMYLENPDGITWRVKKVLALALSCRAENGREKAEVLLPAISDEEARCRGHVYIAGIGNPEKRERMKIVFDAYMDGKSLKEVLAGCDVSKGSVSGYLNEIESAIGCRIVRGRSAGGSLTSMLKNDTGLLSAKREGSSRKASVRDFHSFRVTWVTLALTAGVPLELVQKVTGHKTTEIVMKHYFQPGREAFRQALQSAMPQLLTNGQKSPKEEMREIIERVTPKTWKQDKARLLALLERV